MSIYNALYGRDGHGVGPNEPEKKGFARFCQMVGRDLGQLLGTNLMVCVLCLPAALGVSLGVTLLSLPLTVVCSAVTGLLTGPAMVLLADCALRSLQNDPSQWLPRAKQTLAAHWKAACGFGCIGTLVLGLLCFLCLFFFYILLINATRTHFEIQRGFSLLPGRSLLTNLKSVLANANIPVLSGIRNSLLVSALSALLSVYFSALTAYGIHAYDFKFKKLAFTFILLIMMMPTQVSALGFVRLITKIGMADTLAPLFLPSIAAPVVFYFMLQYMEGNLPMEIVEAARIDGSGEFSTFNRIVLPILKPALAVQAIFTFVNTWNNYFTPALVLSSSGKKTLPILIAQLRSADFLKFDMGQVYMMVAIAILPVIAVYLCLSKFIVRGVALGGVKG